MLVKYDKYINIKKRYVTLNVPPGNQIIPSWQSINDATQNETKIAKRNRKTVKQ